MRPSGAPPGPQGRFYLAQLDVLRGLAVLAVVAFHAGVPWSSGGFLGVDVFFVLSGFLITRLLVVELETTGTIALRAFEARRIRRLWPALALVIVATLALGVLVWSPLEWRQQMYDAAAGAGYVANVAFARHGVGYFDRPLEESPYLHLWSLGVEEQFYLGWPLALLGAAYIARRLGLDRQRTLSAVVAGVGTLSLGLMIWLVHGRDPHVFFSTPARLWELAAGGLVGLRAATRPGGGKGGALYVALGLVLLLGALVLPGLRPAEPLLQTIVPVAATAVLLEGIRRGSRLPLPGAMASLLAWLGWYSYGWYLWHWPLIASAKLLWRTDDVRYLLAASTLALLAAVASKRWLEDPIRFRRSASLLGRLPTWGVILGVVGVVGTALGTQRLLRLHAFRNPQILALAKIQDDINGQGVIARCPLSPFAEGCVLGDSESTRVLVVAGDSHAAHWLPALDSAGRVLGVKVVPHVRGACPPQPLRFHREADESGDVSEDTVCAAFEKQLPGILQHYGATALVLASTTGYEDHMLGKRSPEQRDRLWEQSMANMLRNVPPNVRIVIIEKSPHLGFNPVDCLARSAVWHMAPACDAPYAAAARLAVHYTRLDADAASHDTRVQIFPTIGLLCPGGVCRALSGDTVVFRNDSHLTPRYTLGQTGRWTPYLGWAIGLDSVPPDASWPLRYRKHPGGHA